MLGFSFDLFEKYSLGEEDFDNLNGYFSKALRDLPTGTIFFKQDIFKEEIYDTTKFKKGNFLEKCTADYFNGLPFISHTTNVFFILPNRLVDWKKLQNPFRPPHKKDFIEFDERIKNFNVGVKQAIDYLRGIKLSGGKSIKIEPLSRKYLDDYYDYINSGLNENYSVDIKNEWNYLKIGEQYCSVLKFPQEDKFPETLTTCRVDTELSNDMTKFFKNYGDNFGFDLGFTHIYNQIAIIDDNKKHYNQASKNGENLTKFRKFDRSNSYWAEQVDTMLKEMAKHSDYERIIRGHNNVIVFAKNETELQSRVNMVSERFKDIDIKPERAFGDNLLALYEYSFPLNADLFMEDHFYIGNLEMFNSFAINGGAYKNDREGIRYNSRLQGMSPVIVDVWDDDKKYMFARNFFILAPTGSGKSFNANHIISYFYSDGAKQVIIDLGGSYKKLQTLFPNDIAYIVYKEGDNLGVNPFDLGGEEITTGKIDELVEFIGVHFRREGDLTPQERAVLRKIVELYYKNVPANHSLPSFIKAFVSEKEDIVKHLDIQNEFFNVEEFVLLMSEFIDNGAYSFLYDDTKESIGANLLEKRIIIFELDAIRGNQLLLSIMLQLISTTIDKVIWKDKSTRGVVLFDEVAEQLKWDGMLRRIQWFYQAIRKQNGSVGIVLQSVNQLPNNELSNAIIENTQVLYVLGANDYRVIQNRFNLSNHAFYQMSSLKSDFSGNRKYSEVFILRGKTHQVYRLEVPKEVFWAYQTDGAMNNILMKIYEMIGDMEKAIQIMIKREKFFEELKDDISTRIITEEEAIFKIQRLIKNLEYEKTGY